MDRHLVLSCEGCIVGPGPRCSDCLVTALCSEGPAHLDAGTTRAVELFQSCRLLPPLRRVTG